MFEHSENYMSPLKAYVGAGSDIKWCSRRNGRKKCCLCGRYAEFKEWSVSWKWHYLLAWHDEYAGMRYGYLHTDLEVWSPWYKAVNIHIIKHGYYANQPFPKRYSTKGLGEYKLRKLFLKGCNEKKPCICVKLAQRGSWYCPHCFNVMEIMAKNHGCDIHDIITSDVEEVHRERLLVLLAQLK